jgi:NAD(P)H dehydrogenase (quinone)
MSAMERPMNVLIVFAHPEPKSFNGALKDFAVATLGEAGHEVVVSDLYGMAFEARVGRHDFLEARDPNFLKIQAEESHAAKTDGFGPDIKAEMDKLDACDALIFQFPIYWFGLPAVLKGWVDRVFALGYAYGGGRWFDNGAFKGKLAMLSLTTGATAPSFGPDGRNGDMEMLLWPVNNGIFRFCGFEVLPPFIAYGVSRVDDATRQQYFANFRERLLSLETTAPLFFHGLADFDEDGRLKPEVAPRTIGQRRPAGTAP